jgi:hypothetical protein
VIVDPGKERIESIGPFIYSPRPDRTGLAVIWTLHIRVHLIAQGLDLDAEGISHKSFQSAVSGAT